MKHFAEVEIREARAGREPTLQRDSDSGRARGIGAPGGIFPGFNPVAKCRNRHPDRAPRRGRNARASGQAERRKDHALRAGNRRDPRGG